MAREGPSPAVGPAEHVSFAPDAVSLFWVESIAIMAWHKAPSARVMDALHELASPRRVRYPTGMSFIHIGRVEYALIDNATRDVFVRVTKELDKYIVATAVVARASGFLASTVRSVATGILVLAKVSHEIRFHERAEELMEWLPERHERATGVALDRGLLQATLLHAESL
jgi:hypothetical protein